MPTNMQIPIALVICALFVHAPAFGDARASADLSGANRGCVRMSVTAREIASQGKHTREQYRIRFENRCDSVRIVYWCADSPTGTPAMQSPCARTGTSIAVVAAPLYAVVKQLEFQWAFPHGTRIRYIDCSDSTYPTSDFRCRPAAAKN